MPRAQQCTNCTKWTAVSLTDDGLRVAGWLIYDGRSLTGKPLHVRICPDCQERMARRYGKGRRRKAPPPVLPGLQPPPRA